MPPKYHVPRRRRTRHTSGYDSGATRCLLSPPSSDTVGCRRRVIGCGPTSGHARPNAAQPTIFYYLFKKGLPKTKTVSARLLLIASEPPLLLAASVSPFAGRPFFLSWVFLSAPCCCLHFSRLRFPLCCLLLLVLLLLASLSPLLFPCWCLPDFMVSDFIEMLLCFDYSTFVPFK